ncbi:MAG: hypothetical protein P8M05_04850 [Flavobacteriales bacterium]|nr:hypothetical protein [Flavobacteriales bacterium]
MTTTIKAKPHKRETPKEKSLIETERQTIVHIKISTGGNMRIWPSTFLIENETGKRLKLLKSFNISTYPQWQYIDSGNNFTLIFEGLSKNCNAFKLVEIIPEPGAFIFDNIQRNRSDVYRIVL